MATRVVLIQRQDRGRRVRRVRLVGMQTAETWAPEETALDPAAQLTGAADWIDERLGAAGEGAPSLTAIVVDAEGAVIDWLTAPTAETQVVQAALARASAGAAADDDFEEFSASPAGRFGRDATVADASIQAAGQPTGASNGAPGRLGAMTLPDADVRLLLDRLDTHGRSAGRVLSIWHALSAAWDPSAGDPGGSGDPHDAEGRIVATDAPVTACVLIDPEGALIWSWARGGALVTGGRMRLARAEAEGSALRHVDISRLTSDWLSWSAQLGQAPGRIICICPPMDAGAMTDVEDVGAALGAAAALTPQQIGEALGAAWPGASVDMAVTDDPIESTLDRLVRQADLGRMADPDDPQASLVALSSRPGRAQRGAYLAICAATIGLAALLAVTGVRQMRAADRFEAAREEVVAATAEEAAIVDPAIVSDFSYHISQRIEDLTGLPQGQMLRSPPRPILEELDAIALFLGEHGYKITLQEINLSSAAVTVKFEAPDTETAEAVEATAHDVALNVRYLGNRQGNNVSLIGRWIADDRAGGGR